MAKIVLGLSNEKYHSRKAWSSSQLKVANEDIALFKKKYIDKTIPREFKKAWVLGTYSHEKLLEPDIYAPFVYPYENMDKRKVEYKIWASQNSEKDFNLLITQKELRALNKMYDSVHEYPEALELFKGNTNEVSVFFDYRKMKFRVRLDSWKKETNHIIDYKTSAFPVDRSSFLKKVDSLDYDLSASMYLVAMEKLTGKKHRWSWVVTQSVEPYSTVVYHMSKDLYEQGLQKFHDAIDAIKIAKLDGFKVQKKPQILSYQPIGNLSKEVDLYF